MIPAPLRVGLRPSRWLTAILAVAHGNAATMVALVPIALWLQIACISALALSLVICVRRIALLRDPDSVAALEISTDNVLTVQTQSGGRVECVVLPSTYVAAYLSVLNLREIDRGSVRHVIVVRDSADADDFRNLRTWLRWKGAAHES